GASGVLKRGGARGRRGGAKGSPRASWESEVRRRGLAGGARPDPPGTPTLRRLDVTPRERVLVEPDDRVALKVTATFSDGTKRDVTRLAVFEPSNLGARVGRDGVAVRQGAGETAIPGRYLGRQGVVGLAFVPARKGFVWQAPPEANYVDRHVFAKLRTLRTNPSEVCPDHVFLRRAYLDAIGVPPTAAEARRFLADRRPDKRARLIDAL